jgi:hypothetical protein
MASLNFDATNVAPSDSFAPLPAGTYIAQVTDSSIKPTKSGTGTILNLTWTILDGQFANRKVFDRVNIQNANPEAEKIGQRQLSSICHAAGVLKLADSNQLHGRPCKITLKIRVDAQWGDSNEVKAYESAGAGAAPGVPSFAQQAASAPIPPSAAPPWAKAAA